MFYNLSRLLPVTQKYKLMDGYIMRGRSSADLNEE